MEQEGAKPSEGQGNSLPAAQWPQENILGRPCAHIAVV